jgi:hypothetical protein
MFIESLQVEADFIEPTLTVISAVEWQAVVHGSLVRGKQAG